MLILEPSKNMKDQLVQAPHFSDEKVKAQRGVWLAQHHNCKY
jgi:hypothetical protein